MLDRNPHTRRAMLILAVGFASLAVAVASPAPPPAAPPPSPAPSPAITGRPAAAPTRPAPSPIPPPVLEGTVRGPDGKPVADARVRGWTEEVDIPYPPGTASTDAAGRFRLAVRSLSPVTVRVEAHGFAARSVRHVRPGAPLSITLASGVTLQGVVRDAASGSAVAGATVEAHDEMRPARSSDADAGVARTTTGAKGDYLLEGLAPGLYTLSAFARGLGRADRRSAPTG
ncbi:MAG TPA: carboxypeptidase-like regulatory domain-containing protein, partial [Vicinamibacteria bacterium]|nr:carboxypeptidase-like regulatory domain-containing protein [Vicinamibacteria bacterium]